jgi:putative DNA primase/helicase
LRHARQTPVLLEDDDKRLSKSMVFRDARGALGVQTTREGFGPGSKFVLSLPVPRWRPLARSTFQSASKPARACSKVSAVP